MRFLVSTFSTVYRCARIYSQMYIQYELIFPLAIYSLKLSDSTFVQLPTRCVTICSVCFAYHLFGVSIFIWCLHHNHSSKRLQFKSLAHHLYRKANNDWRRLRGFANQLYQHYFCIFKAEVILYHSINFVFCTYIYSSIFVCKNDRGKIVTRFVAKETNFDTFIRMIIKRTTLFVYDVRTNSNFVSKNGTGPNSRYLGKRISPFIYNYKLKVQVKIIFL